MIKKTFQILIVGLFLNLFLINDCFGALPDIDTASTTNISDVQAVLNWEYSDFENEDFKQFKILWRDASSTEWNAIYPSKEGGPEYLYPLRGIYEETSYEWRIKAEGLISEMDSDFYESASTTFTTPAIETEDDEEEEGPPGGPPGGDLPFDNLNPLGDMTLAEFIDKVMVFLVNTGFIIAPLLIIYAGFNLIIKQGDVAAVTQAKQILFWTVIALSIMLFAKGLPSAIKDIFN